MSFSMHVDLYNSCVQSGHVSIKLVKLDFASSSKLSSWMLTSSCKLSNWLELAYTASKTTGYNPRYCFSLIIVVFTRENQIFVLASPADVCLRPQLATAYTVCLCCYCVPCRNLPEFCLFASPCHSSCLGLTYVPAIGSCLV